MKHLFFDVFNKRGYKLGHIMTNGFQDPLEVARQEYGKNVNHVKEWEKIK